MKRNKMDFDFNGRYARHVARVAAERDAITEALNEIAGARERFCDTCGETYDKAEADLGSRCPKCADMARAEIERHVDSQAEACRVYFQGIG